MFFSETWDFLPLEIHSDQWNSYSLSEKVSFCACIAYPLRPLLISDVEKLTSWLEMAVFVDLYGWAHSIDFHVQNDSSRKFIFLCVLVNMSVCNVTKRIKADWNFSWKNFGAAEIWTVDFLSGKQQRRPLYHATPPTYVHFYKNNSGQFYSFTIITVDQKTLQGP